MQILGLKPLQLYQEISLLNEYKMICLTDFLPAQALQSQSHSRTQLPGLNLTHKLNDSARYSNKLPGLDLAHKLKYLARCSNQLPGLNLAHKLNDLAIYSNKLPGLNLAHKLHTS